MYSARFESLEWLSCHNHEFVRSRFSEYSMSFFAVCYCFPEDSYSKFPFFIFNIFILLYFIYVFGYFCLHAQICAPHACLVPWIPQNWSYSCELPCSFWESNPHFLEERPMFLTTEPSLQPSKFPFFNYSSKQAGLAKAQVSRHLLQTITKSGVFFFFKSKQKNSQQWIPFPMSPEAPESLSLVHCNDFVG